MALKMYDEKKAVPQNIIGIAAGKGGVGKSTLTINLALALKRFGLRVGILDADLYGPSVRKMLPEDHVPAQRGDKILPAIARGIPMISMAYFRSEQEASVVRAPIANSLITQFVHKVEWGALDFLLIDFPPGTGDIQLTLSQQANLTAAIMVTTPQEVSLLDVRKAKRMFDQVRIPVAGIVENMSYYQHTPDSEPIYLFGKGGGEELARETGLPLLGQIPVDPKLCQTGDRGESIFSYEPSLTSESLIAIAKNFLEQLEIIKNEKEVVQQIQQNDPRSFSIIWKDGQNQTISYSTLQKNCPCASCVDENTGVRIVDEEAVDENVGAKSLRKVGRYALQVEFTSGCSTGIYDFEMLRALR